ncbi:hypothetical protein A9Q83_06400 [Alphaproteobacteria bacterium 46_93_T64]|nr:hypothetical protein A9Q83_06400 [Alphaproteobacteria bacterium 46_93_T64]
MTIIDLNALEIFSAVVSEGSVSKAAVKLNRVQSNISTRIKQLEEQLNKKLFHRHNRKLTLTADGELLLTYADKLITLSLEASEALSEDTPKGVFRIGAMESTAAARLPELLRKYNAAYPNVQIELVTDTAGGLIQRLKKSEIEVAFVAEPIFGEDLQTQAVFEEELVLIVPSSFSKVSKFKDLDGKPLIAFEQGCAYRRYLESWLFDEAVVPGSIFSVSSYLAIFACVAAGTGFAVAPKSVLDIVDTSSQFQQIPMPNQLSHIKTMLVNRKGYGSKKLDSLKEFLPNFTTT